MIKWTLGTVGFLALAACAQQEPPAAPANPPAEALPGPAPVAVTTAPAPAAAPAPALPPATNEERAKLFQDCWALFNAKDWAKFPACYSESATSERVDTGLPLSTGRASVAKAAQAIATELPDATGELQLTLVSGNDVASIVLFRGTNGGPLTLPGGASVPATNKKVGLLLGQVLELSADGRSIAKERLYSDTGALLGQLGLNPAPHRKLIEKGAAEKPVVLATNSELEKANLALHPKAIEAFNKHDVNALTALMTDDVTLTEGSAPADKVGKAAVKKSYQELFKGFSDVKLDVTKVWAAGDYVVAEGVFSGTNDGNIPSWKLKKTGKKVSTRYLEVSKFAGGKVKNVWTLDNGMALASQLGLLPQAPGNAKDAPGAKPAAAKPAAAAGPAGKPATSDATAASPAKPATPAAPLAKPATPAAGTAAAVPATPATPAAPGGPANKPAKPAGGAAPAKPTP
jgi:predicted ester cyclase